MPFWGTERFRQRLGHVVLGGDAQRVKQGAYELSLGGEAYLSGEEQKRLLKDGEIVSIRPGTTALLITREQVAIPHDSVGFISLKSRAKLPGLVNVSGFHVDPGFKGKLVFTVYNAGVESQTFACGEPLFLLWLADMDKVSDPYDGNRKDQQSIPSELVGRLTAPGVAPSDLQQQIERLREHLEQQIEKLKEHRTFFIGIGVAIVLGVVILVLEGFPFSRLGERLGEWVLPGRPSAPSGPASPPSTSERAAPGAR